MTPKQLAIARVHPEDDPTARTKKRRLVARLKRAMALQSVSIMRLAALIGVSRGWVYRLLDPLDLKFSVATIWRAERVLGVDLLR